MHHWISVVCGPTFTKFFSPNVEVVLLIEFFFDFRYVDPFQDICDQSWRLKKSTEFCMFLAPKFFGGEPPNFWSGIIKFSQLPIMRRSFTAIGRGSSEIRR